MSASDSNAGPESVPSPEALASGQRTLAAIVFTDTVSFSALMRQNEDLTLRLVARDMAYMKATCEAFGGQVLKSTGDGLLMLFTSAVQAVACALEIQRDLQKKSTELPKSECLQHRIGIHLGDVFQHGGDAMGDGVNIAARLQTEAVPGGICLSKTVFDVVHNRLPFYVNELGARRLKNIGKVTAYQISPNENRNWNNTLWFRFRWLMSAVSSWIVLAAVVGVFFYLGMHREWAKSHPDSPWGFTLFPLHKTVAKPAAKILAEVPPIPVPAAQPPEPAIPADGKLIVVSDQEFDMARFEHMQKYDFEGMRDWIAIHDWPEKPQNMLDERCRKFQHLLRWMQEGLHNYSASSPLVITSSSGKQTSFWTVSFGGLRMKTDTQSVTVMREQMPPLMIIEITGELLKEHPVTGEEAVRIQDEANSFAEFYHVKTLQELEAPAQ
jgi:class 3 adenylate cyclase